LNAYLDTSVLVTMFTRDSHSERVRAWLPASLTRLTLSDWTLTEFTSALGVGVRFGRLDRSEAAGAEAALDEWCQTGAVVVPVTNSDVQEARQIIGRSGEPLRGPDALHIAIAQRLGCALASLDVGLVRATTALGLPVEPI
jgi:hypothetical protein